MADEQVNDIPSGGVPPESAAGSRPEVSDATRAGSSDAWREVGRQFQVLGESLASALRVSLESEENRKHLQSLQTGVESMLKEVSQAIRETASSPKTQQVKSDAERAASSVRAAGEQTVQEVRPHLVAALRQVNAELQKFISRMEQEQPAPATPPVHDAPPDVESQSDL